MKMEDEIKTYDEFPKKFVFLCVVFSLVMYALGAYILSFISVVPSAIYLVYCLLMEIIVLKRSCVNCYYYGKSCGMGKGKLCPLFFKRGSPVYFAERKISWKDLLPDFMIFIIPLIGGAMLLLTKGFSWFIAGLLAVLLILSLVGNAVIRGSCACKFCKQREIGCPAEKLFQKK